MPGSKSQNESYISITEGIRADGSPARGTYELPCFTCCHCNCIVVMNMARTRPRGYCARCDKWTCDSVGCNLECNPITQAVDLALKYEGSSNAEQPFLLRGAHGEVLFDTRLRDKERIF